MCFSTSFICSDLPLNNGIMSYHFICFDSWSCNRVGAPVQRFRFVFDWMFSWSWLFACNIFCLIGSSLSAKLYVRDSRFFRIFFLLLSSLYNFKWCHNDMRTMRTTTTIYSNALPKPVCSSVAVVCEIDSTITTTTISNSKATHSQTRLNKMYWKLIIFNTPIAEPDFIMFLFLYIFSLG